MTRYEEVQAQLRASPRTWLITGAAGFIGSNLLETLLRLGQNVRGLDNLSTGHRRNLAGVEAAVGSKNWARFQFFEGDIRDLTDCQRAGDSTDYVLHHAALGSVPLSVEQPLTANKVNVEGTINVLVAARDHKVQRFIYASSSAIYGDQPGDTMMESQIGRPLSPYAVTKYANELYASVFSRCYGLETIGLRYFNVFGPRQDPNGAYAAVIPKWITALLKDEPIHINGDGETSRDFCYIDNVVQANLLAATTPNRAAVNQACNIALNQRTTLNELFALLRDRLARTRPGLAARAPLYREFRAGDVRHSQADISRARQFLGYEPTHRVADGLDAALRWYETHLI